MYAISGASTCMTANGGGWGAKTGLYFIDMNADPKVTHEARCITARQDAGISNRRGEHSGVIISGARAVLTPERESVRQQGRRIKEPNEPMFTLTAQDKHGVTYNGLVRRLMPQECFRLQVLLVHAVKVAVIFVSHAQGGLGGRSTLADQLCGQCHALLQNILSR